MPELPEVEAARVLLQQHCLNKAIESASVAQDEKVIEGISSEQLEKQLQGRQIAAAKRKGKHLWIDFKDGGASVMFHFGMTGSMIIKGIAAARYKTFVVGDEEWPPRFCKVQINLAGDVHLAFTDARRFARVRVQEDPPAHPPISALGFDLLLSMPPLQDFTAALAKQQRQVKVVLMDQSFSAGVGNWVADEVLFQAHIHPEDRANGLNAEQVERLHHWLHEVPRQACEVGADSGKFPSSWLFKHRWSQKGTPAVEGGHPIQFGTVGGRTTAWVPAVQKRTTADRKPAKPLEGKKRAGRKSSKAADSNDAEEADADEASGDEGAGGGQPEVKKPARKQGQAKRKAEAGPAADSGPEPAVKTAEGKTAAKDKDDDADKKLKKQANAPARKAPATKGAKAADRGGSGAGSGKGKQRIANGGAVASGQEEGAPAPKRAKAAKRKTKA